MAGNIGLYNPAFEHDACGIGFVASIKGYKSHQHISDALTVLENMEHRGACGCEPNTGDGAGILIQIPHLFFQHKAKELGFILPDAGQYGVGMIFFPMDRVLRDQCRVLLNDYIDECDFELIGYRDVPTQNESLGASALMVEPKIEQVFVKPKSPLDKKSLYLKMACFAKQKTGILTCGTSAL